MIGADYAVDDAMLQAMRAAAVYQARRVARTLKLSAEEREDVEQDILLVLLERPRFFEGNGGPGSNVENIDRLCGRRARGGHSSGLHMSIARVNGVLLRTRSDTMPGLAPSGKTERPGARGCCS